MLDTENSALLWNPLDKRNRCRGAGPVPGLLEPYEKSLIRGPYRLAGERLRGRKRLLATLQIPRQC